MRKNDRFFQNMGKLLGILAGCFALCLAIEKYFGASTLVPAVMALAVFLVSLITDGFLYGIIASLLSVLELNFAFAFPYFAFNFSIPENVICGTAAGRSACDQPFQTACIESARFFHNNDCDHYQVRMEERNYDFIRT